MVTHGTRKCRALFWLIHKNVNVDLPQVAATHVTAPWCSFATEELRSNTSHCKTNKNLIKVPLIVDGGHLAAVLCRVWPGGVEDQDVGRLSELSSVLQVPFRGRKESLYNCSFTNTARLHGPEKQNSLPSSSEVLFIRLSSESWVISLKFSGLAGWCSLFKRKKKKKELQSSLPDILFWKYT